MPSHASQAQRLQVLLDLNILDTAPDECFDRITRMAARLFQVPMAFVSLVDADRLWFKSRVGFPYAEAPSARSFCAHAIRQDEVLVVCDAAADEHFATSPYVRGYPHVRFYAGQPLAVDGVYIGTLCLVDSVAREFGDEERALLRDLASMVANEVAAGALREAERRLRCSEASLRALLDHLPDSVLLLDAEGAVVSCNPAAEHLFGQEAAALAGRQAAALLGLAAGALAPAGGAAAARIESVLARGDGNVSVEAALSTLEIDGRPHLLASIRDVSAQRAALEASRAAEQRRRDFFRSATHELRTPMTSILGFSDLLIKRDFDPATGRELLGIVHKQSTRLVAVINQMLDLARIEAGDAEELNRSRVVPEAMLAAALAAAVPPGRSADIAVDAAPSLPPVLGNEERLRQALGNLVANALQFSAPGQRVDIGLAPAQRDGRAGLALHVRDRGIGMTPAQQAQMFDAFYRAGEQPGHEGAGLGLALVREILAAHGGAIEVASRPGAGTSVTLWLPAAAEQA